MIRRQGRLWDRQTLLLLPLVLVALTAVVMSSCSGSDGDSNGELCDQCGDDPDGPCQPSVVVDVGPDAPPPCDVPNATVPCTVQLICRRKADSAQQRCFPKDPIRDDVNFQFECDGSRPGVQRSPEPTEDPTPEPTAQPSECGNGTQEGDEDCDGSDFGSATCANQGCDFPGGELSCSNDCNFDFSTCAGGGQGCG